MCESEVAQSCPTLRDPMDRSLPGSSIHGIFEARVLELGCHCLLRTPQCYVTLIPTEVPEIPLWLKTACHGGNFPPYFAFSTMSYKWNLYSIQSLESGFFHLGWCFWNSFTSDHIPVDLFSFLQSSIPSCGCYGFFIHSPVSGYLNCFLISFKYQKKFLG